MIRCINRIIRIFISKVNGLLLRMISILQYCFKLFVCASAFSYDFFQTAFYTSNNSFIYLSPPRKAGGLKFHIIFLELIHCCASSAVKLKPISLKIDIGFLPLLKNRVNPLMHADALSKGTNSKQIPRVEEHVNKNISKL